MRRKASLRGSSKSLDITVERTRAQLVRIVGSGDEVTSGQIPFTPHAKRVLSDRALREALSLGHNYIGTEHLLLGLIRDEDGVAVRLLLDFDADPERIRNEVTRMLGGPVGWRGQQDEGLAGGRRVGPLPESAAANRPWRFGVRPYDEGPPGPRTPRAARSRAEVTMTGLTASGLRDAVCSFRTNRSALAFVAAAHRTRSLSDVDESARCRRNPADGGLWVESGVGIDAAAQLAWPLGGEVFGRRGRLLHRVRGAQSGQLADEDASTTMAELSTWPEVPLIELLTATSLAPAPRVEHARVCVVVFGPIARWVLRRCLEADANVSLVAVVCHPLTGSGVAQAATMLHVDGEHHRLPGGLLRALDGLPYVAVCRYGHESALLLAVDRAFALPDADVAMLVPRDEQWLFAGPEFGAWRVEALGEPTEVADLAETAHRVPALPPPVTGAMTGLARPRVDVVPGVGRAARADAVLVDERQLDLVSRYIRWRSLSETVSILPGDGQYLVTEPAGLETEIPFGVPLRFLGPGGLYVESSCDLRPPLPAAARANAFALDDESVVVLCRHGSWRFALEHLVPAWTLWLGAVPEVRDALSPRAAALVEQLATVGGVDGAPRPKLGGPPRDARTPGAESVRRLDLIREGQRLELSGRLEDAAAVLEQAGHFLRAARLFERAAAGLSDAS